MSLDFNESNSEFFDNSLPSLYYENVSNNATDYVTVQNNNGQRSTSAPTAQHYQTSQHERIQPSVIISAPQHITASAEVSTPEVSKSFDSSQNQILKIKFDIVIKLQNDQNQQRTKCVHCVHSSTLPKNRMNPYSKPIEKNFRNKNREDTYSYSPVPVPPVPQLNRNSAVYMQNINNSISHSQYDQQNEDLNESFSDYNI